MPILSVSPVLSRNPLAQMEEEKRDHEAKMKKMESEMEQVFEMKVREKKQKLKDSETDVSIYFIYLKCIYYSISSILHLSYYLLKHSSCFYLPYLLTIFNLARSNSTNTFLNILIVLMPSLLTRMLEKIDL